MKWIAFSCFALIALVTQASAHVLPIPFSDISSISDVIETRFPRGTNVASVGANSQLNPNFLGAGGEYKILNALKEAQTVKHGDNSIVAPTEVDANSYPLSGASGFALGGYKWLMSDMPPQALRPGNYVWIGTGAGSTYAFAGAGATGAACTGTASGLGNVLCDNTACTTFTGQITGQSLNVTVAGTGTGCSLVVGQPIQNAGNTLTVNQFGVPTMIIGKSGSANCPACTGTGGTGTYLVNWSQNVGSGSIRPGIYNEIISGVEEVPAVCGNTSCINTAAVEWQAGISSVVSGNIFNSMAFVHKDDLLLYAAGQMTGVKFKQRFQQGNFATIRDLNTAVTNITNVTTWAKRKPAAYASYLSDELRSSLYAGVAGYALNGSSNDYSATLGTGGPTDKQHVCIKIGTSATNSTVTFNLNASGAVSVGDAQAGSGSPPSAGDLIGLTYDAFSNIWLSTLPRSNHGCLINGMPPEAFLQMATELGAKRVWLVMPYMGSDPITDYGIQYAKFLQANYPSMLAVFEGVNEPWNCAGHGLGAYFSFKSRAYIAVDSTWAANAPGHEFCGGGGDINNEEGKVASLLGQAIRQVSSTYTVAVNMKTVDGGSSAYQANVRSNSYVGQNPTNIPTQSGCAGVDSVQTSCPAPFTRTAAYTAMAGATSDAAAISIANYMNVPTYFLAPETTYAFCYWFQTAVAGCPTRATIQAAYMVQNPDMATYWGAWYTFAQNCGGGASCSPMTVRNYEGGYTGGRSPYDVWNLIGSINSNANATLTLANCPGDVNCLKASFSSSAPQSGAFVGMTVRVTAACGGTWPSIVGNTYTVIATPSTTQIQLNLNSTGLGTATVCPAYSSQSAVMQLTYEGSNNYLTYFRRQAYLWPEIQAVEAGTYNTIAGNSGVCTPGPCSKEPSQFNMSDFVNDYQAWLAWNFDIYGYLMQAACDGCTVSGSTLTLGGNVTGIFTNGLTLFGKGLPALVRINGACTKVGSGPAGSNATDTCPLSASATVASGVPMLAAATPANSNDNPSPAWKAICAWNGNLAACQ